jgi:hypothetical protein
MPGGLPDAGARPGFMKILKVDFPKILNSL